MVEVAGVRMIATDANSIAIISSERMVIEDGEQLEHPASEHLFSTFNEMKRPVEEVHEQTRFLKTRTINAQNAKHASTIEIKTPATVKKTK